MYSSNNPAPEWCFSYHAHPDPVKTRTTKDTVQLANPSHQDSIARQDSTRIKISLSDTLIVDQRCAVFYVADSAQAEKKAPDWAEKGHRRR